MNNFTQHFNEYLFAIMAELVDAYGSGPYETLFVQVRVLFFALLNKKHNINLPTQHQTI